MVTTVSYPSPNLPVLQNGTGGHQLDAESKLSRKRKLATTDDNSDSLHGAPVAKKLLNGANVANLHKSCSTEVLMELDGTKDQRQKRPTSVGSTSLPGSDPELDQNIYVVPGRMPKVKVKMANNLT